METCHMSPGLCVPRYELLGLGVVSGGIPCWGAKALPGPPQLVPRSSRTKSEKLRRHLVSVHRLLIPYRCGLIMFSINIEPLALLHCRSSSARHHNGVRSCRRALCRVCSVDTAATPAAAYLQQTASNHHKVKIQT